MLQQPEAIEDGRLTGWTGRGAGQATETTSTWASQRDGAERK